MRKSLIIFRGLPGTGKTFLINKIKEHIPDLLIISRDDIRTRVFKNPEYSSEEKEQLLSVMLFMIEEHISHKGSIIIDGMTFPTKESILPFSKTAAKHNVQFRIIECFCSEETALQRISGDIIENNQPAAGRVDDLYYHVKEVYEPLTDFHLRVNTDEDEEKNMEKIAIYLSVKINKSKDAD